MQMNILNRLNMEACTGCHSCYSSCPMSAIHMIKNDEGFLMPSINESTCIQCGKCIISCPIIYNPPVYEGENKVYAAYCIDEKQHIQSASGGIFATIAKCVLVKNGYVVGAAFDSKMHLHHIIINNINDLKKLVGTKYVQSEIGSIYKNIYSLLIKGYIVLFSGTPCQIAGLKAFLKKDYNNLYCIDLICHGVPSPLVWNMYLRELSPDDKIVTMTFRDKSKHNMGWPLVFTCQSGKKILENYGDNKYIKGFINNYYLRLSCYHCKFKGLRRCSDITIGDYWGLEKYINNFNSSLGVSAVIIHSESGSKIFNDICQKIKYVKMDEKTVVSDNLCLVKSITYNNKRKIFFKYCNKKGIIKSIDKLSKQSLYEKYIYVIYDIKKYIKKLIKYGVQK